MINLNVARDFHLYKEQLGKDPDAVPFPKKDMGLMAGTAEAPMYVVQYCHTNKNEVFGAVFALPANDVRRDFRAYLPPKFERN